MSNENRRGEYHERSFTDVSEINNFPGKNTHFSIESTNTKPYDISKMTGQPVNQGNSDGSDDNN